jgi:hypothetical protein|tara:strand:+ start:1652 stop:2020 length:369 start_codon:yes stop_codon:yes gene_type:complete
MPISTSTPVVPTPVVQSVSAPPLSPKVPQSDSAPVDDVKIVRMVITLKNKKLEMVQGSDGQWQTVQPKPRVVRKKASVFRGRRIGNTKLYAEMSRRKQRFESTAFGRLRKKHRMELHRRNKK